jgi:vacuolar-type H+-ATPase subunit E/Vma4
VALPELLAALRAQAATRREEELTRADAEAERIRAESRASLAKRKAVHVERAIRDANDAARRSLSEARSEAAASVLQARDRLLGRVRVALTERTRTAIDDLEYRASLGEKLVAALERLPPGKVIVRTPPQLADALARGARSRQGVVVEADADVGAGFVAVSPESCVEIDGTLETSLEHRWPRIAVSVLAEVIR